MVKQSNLYSLQAAWELFIHFLVAFGVHRPRERLERSGAFESVALAIAAPFPWKIPSVGMLDHPDMMLRQRQAYA